MALTPAEFRDKMGSLLRSDASDPEVSHAAADDLMCEALRGLGYGEGIDLFEESTTYYS